MQLSSVGPDLELVRAQLDLAAAAIRTCPHVDSPSKAGKAGIPGPLIKTSCSARMVYDQVRVAGLLLGRIRRCLYLMAEQEGKRPGGRRVTRFQPRFEEVE